MFVEFLEQFRIICTGLQEGFLFLITLLSNIWPLALIGLSTAYIKKHAR